MKTTAPPTPETLLYSPVPPRADAVRLGWMYPYTYGVSMSSLGYLTLFRQLDEDPGVAVERINTDNMAQHSVSDKDLMGFSFSFELDILEILKMLDYYGIPLMATERGRAVPLLFAGGPVVMTNPEPYADFFDFFLIGEGEDMMRSLITAYNKHQHLSDREELIRALAADVPGLYAPSLYNVEYAASGEIAGIHPRFPELPMPVEKQWVKEMDTSISHTPILSEEAIFSNTFLVEVMRGCAHRCRFCLASYSMLPARGPSLETVLQTIETGLKYTNKIGLLGALIADHPQFDEICTYLKGVPDLKVSASSLRADTLTPHIAETFKHGGQKNVTIAIETGSERLRKRINKHLKTEDIERSAAVLREAGIPQLKLYNMVGLPDEEWSDLEETVTLMKQLKKGNPGLKMVFGCSTFVPKAATPFQWMAREESKLLAQKQEFLRKSLVKTCDFRPTSPKWDYVQALFSRGDRRLSRFIIVFARSGANLGALNRALKDMGDSPQPVDFPDLDWYALRERMPGEILPWDLLFLGVGKDTLYKESGLAKSTFPPVMIGER